MTYTHSDKSKLNNLLEELKKYKKDLENINYIHEQKKFFDTMKNFRKFIALKEHDDLYDIFSHSKYFAKFKDFF
jgi:hypothetical protein